MQTLDRDERSAVLPALPQRLWAVVADVTRTPDLSPEVSACRWLDGATGPAVGARFGWFVIERLFRGGNRRVELAHGMEATLRRLGELVPGPQAGAAAQ